MVNKKYNDITYLKNKNLLDKYNFANFFTVVELGEKSYFNIYRTINFNNIEDVSENYYSSYLVKEGDTWTNISFKFYSTIKLWWLICKFNNIENPFTELIPGTYIKILNKEVATQILETIK